jgi:hypothetical protein
MEPVPASDKNCLGNALRDSGHSREPDPPDRMTGVMRVSAILKPTSIPQKSEVTIRPAPLV